MYWNIKMDCWNSWPSAWCCCCCLFYWLLDSLLVVIEMSLNDDDYNPVALGQTFHFLLISTSWCKKILKKTLFFLSILGHVSGPFAWPLQVSGFLALNGEINEWEVLDPNGCGIWINGHPIALVIIIIIAMEVNRWTHRTRVNPFHEVNETENRFERTVNFWTNLLNLHKRTMASNVVEQQLNCQQADNESTFASSSVRMN